MQASAKISYGLLQWKRLLWKTIRDSLSWIFLAITVVGSLIGFLPEKDAQWLREIVYFSWEHVWLLILVTVVIILLALIGNWPRTRAAFKDKNTNIWVIIECCDILKQEGLKVIHTVDTFDTELDRIISRRTLHGAFLQLGEKENAHIDEQIDKALKHTEPKSSDPKLPGRKEQYDLGTVCRVQIADEPYCCVAFTHLKEDGTIEIAKDEYIRCLKRMWRNLASAQNRNDVINVAIMGNRFVDLPASFSTEQKVDLMIQTFFAVAREKACCRVLRICVHPDNVADIDFENYHTIIEHLSKRPII